MSIQEILIPYKPNQTQAEIHKALKRFSVVVLHRGCGKTWLAANELIRRAFTCEDRSGALFVYVAPEKQQAKDIVWEKLKYFCQNIPDLKIREDELTITFPDNNAIVRIAGADQPDRLRGIHPHYVVLDEVGQMKRDVWYEAILPSIQRNKGGVLFIGTPKGDNLFKEMYDFADKKGNEDWYCAYKGVYDTEVYTMDEIKAIRAMMPTAKFEQEYLCKWDAIFTGSYYSSYFENEALNLLGDVPYNPMFPVITGWDLGTADKTVIWFAQQVDGKIHVIDYYDNNNKDIFHYIQVLKNKPYVYGSCILPHDGTQRSWESGKSRIDIIQKHGFRCTQAKKLSPQEGIAIVQAQLYLCKFDKKRCLQGVEYLNAYRARQDAISGESTSTPLHDTSSDAADAFRTLIVGLRKQPGEGGPVNPHQWVFDFMRGQGKQGRNQDVISDYDYLNFQR